MLRLIEILLFVAISHAWWQRNRFNCFKCIVDQLGGFRVESLWRLRSDWRGICHRVCDTVTDNFMTLSMWILFKITTLQPTIVITRGYAVEMHFVIYNAIYLPILTI